MQSITITDLQNGKQDVDHISAIATSTAPTATDRFGATKQTMKGILDDLNAIAAITATGVNRAAAEAAAALAATNGATQVALATTQAGQAAAAKTAAEAARDAAIASADIYATTAAGIAATTTGKYFSVPSVDSNEYLILYLNSAGTAVEKKRYPSVAAVPIVGVEGVYNLVNPAAPVMVGGLNSLGNWIADAAYNSIATRVNAGDTLVLRNTVETYAGGTQYNASFFSALPPSPGTFIAAAPGALATNPAGAKYIAPVVPAGAKYLVFNVKFNAEVISWFAAKDTVFSGTAPFIPAIARTNDIPVLDRAARASIAKAFSAVEGEENLYNVENNLIDRYISSAWVVQVSSAAQAWRIAAIPVQEGKTYAVYFGPTYPGIYHGYGMFGTGKLQSDIIVGSKIAFLDTIDSQVKTFTIPLGSGITYAFINAKVSAEDYLATLIVLLGSAVPVRPLPYTPVLIAVDGKPLKDVTARGKIAALESLPKGGGTRFYGQKFYYFGDSITEGTQGGYVGYITDILKCVPTNYGSSGSRAGRLVARATNQLNRQDVGSTIYDGNPDYTGVAAVTIMIGTNDLAGGVIGSIADIPAQSLQSLPFTASGGATISTPDQYWALFPNTFYGNVGLVLEYIKYRNSETLIYLVTPPHASAVDMSVMADHLKALAKFYSVRFIDAQNEAGLERKQYGKYSYDGTHFNTLGNELWGKYVGYRILNS